MLAKRFSAGLLFLLILAACSDYHDPVRTSDEATYSRTITERDDAFRAFALQLSRTVQRPEAWAMLVEELADSQEPYVSLAELANTERGQKLLDFVQGERSARSWDAIMAQLYSDDPVIGFPAPEHRNAVSLGDEVRVAAVTSSSGSDVFAFDAAGRRHLLPHGDDAPSYPVLVITPKPLVGSEERTIGPAAFSDECDETAVTECPGEGGGGSGGGPNYPVESTYVSYVYLGWFGRTDGSNRIEYRVHEWNPTSQQYGRAFPNVRTWNVPRDVDYYYSPPVEIAPIPPRDDINFPELSIEVWEIRHWYYFGDVHRITWKVDIWDHNVLHEYHCQFGCPGGSEYGIRNRFLFGEY